MTYRKHSTQSEELPNIDPKVEKNATFPCLQHPSTLKYLPKRTAELVLRAAYLHKGNALMSLERYDEAISAYELAIPLLEPEPRCSRIDWERISVLVNIGNCYSRLGKFELAHKYYDQGEQLGIDHQEAEDGDKQNGTGLRLVAMRARAFAFQKQGRDGECKELLREVLMMQQEFNAVMLREKAEMKAEMEENNRKEHEEASKQSTVE
jgi:tetratricopeptide (TPR) repeat protein